MAILLSIEYVACDSGGVVCDMIETDILEYYKTARDEILLRVRLRDQILTAYLIAIGAVFTGLSVSEGNPVIAIFVPFLSYACSIVLAGHDIAITSINQYIKMVIKSKQSESLTPWDCSSVFVEKAYAASINLYRGRMMVLFLPSVLALVIGFDSVSFPVNFPSVLWYMGLWFTLLSGISLIKSLRYRNYVNSRI